MNKQVLITISALLVCTVTSLRTFAQMPIPIEYDISISAVFTPEAPVVPFTFTTSTKDTVSVTLTFLGHSVPAYLTLYNSNNQAIESNEFLVYPGFQGAYIIFSLPMGGTYRIDAEAYPIDEPAEFQLVLHLEAEDETGGTLELEEQVEGNIGVALDQDLFILPLNSKDPVLITVLTPQFILDPVVAVYDPSGTMIAFADDLYTAVPMAVVEPPAAGSYSVVVQGQFESSRGPYLLTAHAVKPLPVPPSEDIGTVASAGGGAAFALTLSDQNAYEFFVQGQNGFEPAVALVDSALNVLAYDLPSGGETSRIRPYTPEDSDTFYAVVVSSNPLATGKFRFSSSPVADETDGVPLSTGGARETVISPAGDIDRVAVAVQKDRFYSLVFYTTAYELDPALRILDESGQVVFANDNSVNGPYSQLSRFRFPSAGFYTIELSASPANRDKAAQTGIGSVEFAEGAPFDRQPPLLIEKGIQSKYSDGRFSVMLPPNAARDDTLPLTGYLHRDRTGERRTFPFSSETASVVEMEADADEIFFVTLEDSADTHNRVSTFAFPRPSVLSTLPGMGFRMAINERNEIFVVDADQGGMYKIEPGQIPKIFLSGEDTRGGLYGPNALAFDRQGSLYMSNAFTNEILRIDPSTGRKEVFASGLSYPIDLAFDAEGVLYVSQLANDDIDKVYPDGRRETFVTEITNPYGVAFGPDGFLYVCSTEYGQSSVFRVSRNGDVEPFVPPFAWTLESIAVDKEGFIYTADGTNGVLYRIGPDRQVVRLAGGLEGPSGLAFGKGSLDKQLLATDMGTTADSGFQFRIFSIPTGRRGLSLPIAGIPDWGKY